MIKHILIKPQSTSRTLQLVFKEVIPILGISSETKETTIADSVPFDATEFVAQADKSGNGNEWHETPIDFPVTLLHYKWSFEGHQIMVASVRNYDVPSVKAFVIAITLANNSTVINFIDLLVAIGGQYFPHLLNGSINSITSCFGSGDFESFNATVNDDYHFSFFNDYTKENLVQFTKTYYFDSDTNSTKTQLVSSMLTNTMSFGGKNMSIADLIINFDSFVNAYQFKNIAMIDDFRDFLVHKDSQSAKISPEKFLKQLWRESYQKFFGEKTLADIVLASFFKRYF